MTWRPIAPRSRSKTWCALTCRLRRSAPSAAWQASHTTGTCSISRLTTIGSRPAGPPERPAPPVPRHAQPLAWRLRRRLVLVGLVLGLAARRGGVLVGATVTPLAHRTRAASLIAPLGIVARRRSRTGRRVLAQPIGQRPRQFAEPPRQIFKLLPRQTRKVCSFELGQLRDTQTRHRDRRIPFARSGKPSVRRPSEGSQPSQTPRDRRGGVNDCLHPGVCAAGPEVNRRNQP